MAIQESAWQFYSIKMHTSLQKYIFLFVLLVSAGLVTAQDNSDSSQNQPDSTESGPHTFSLPQIITYIDSPVVEQRQVYTSVDLEKIHAEDLPSLLKQLGMQILEYGPYGLESKPSIRGFTDETVRVVIDGVCMNNAQYGTFDFSSINMNSVERIEIVRGGFTEGIEDEGAVGGAIYITTKKQTLGHSFYTDSSLKTFLAAGIPLDTFSQKIGYNGQITETSFLKADFSGTFAQNKYVYQTSLGNFQKRENADVKDAKGNLTFSKYFGDGNCFTLGEMLYIGEKNCPGKEFSKNPGLQKDLSNSISASVFNPAVSNLFNLRNNLVWTKTTRLYEDNSGKSKHYINDIKYIASVEFYDLGKIRQSAGLTIDFTNLDSTDDGIHNQASGVLKETTKIFFNDIFSMSLPLAAKFSGKNFEFIPKLGLCADSTYFSIKIDGYRMIQFPNMDDLYWKSSGYSGNPDLKTESGWGADLSFDVKNIVLPFSICFFTNWYENKIQWASTSGTWRPENVASAFYFGIDFNSSLSLFQNLLTLTFNGEYLYNELRTDKNSQTYKKKIMWTPDFTGSLTANLNLSCLDLNCSANYTGKQYLSNLNISYLEPYILYNASLTLKLWKHFKPYFRGENLTNLRYCAIEGYPMPGISFTLGGKVEF